MTCRKFAPLSPKGCQLGLRCQWARPSGDHLVSNINYVVEEKNQLVAFPKKGHIQRLPVAFDEEAAPVANVVALDGHGLRKAGLHHAGSEA